MTAVAVIASGHTQIIWLCASSLGATAQAAGLPRPPACRACSGPGFEEGLDAGDDEADRVIAADRDADPAGRARHGMRARADAARAPGCPAPAAYPPASESPSLPPPAATESRNVRDGMSRRPARGSQPAATRRGQRVQRNPESSPMRVDGWLTGYGMAPAVYDVPAVERSRATLPAALWARSCLPARGADRTGDHLDRAPAAPRPAPRLAVRIRVSRRGHPCR